MIKFNVGTQDVPKSVSQVTVVSPKNSKVDYNLPKGVIQKIEKLFADKENGFFTLYEDDALRLVSVYAKDESEVVNDSEELRLFGAAVYKALETEKVEKAQLVGFTDALSTCERSLFLEGMLLAQYGFDKYKKKKNESSLKMVYIDEESFIEGELEAMENLVKAVSFAKDLVNEPVNYLDAPKFSELAKEMASMYGFSTEVFDKAKIEELKMGGLLAVNQGSDTPPTFNIFTHKQIGRAHV